MTVDRHALINVQLGQYPDSRIMSLREVYSEWMDDDGDMAEWKANFEAYYGRVYRDPVEKRNQLCDYIIKQRQDYKLRVARSLALCLQNKINVFYECGLITGGRNEDGSQDPSRYQWRGCRYGTEPHEYISGFGKD